MKKPNHYYISFARLQAINTNLFSIYREYLATANYETHHQYYQAFDLLTDFMYMMGHEKNIIIKAQQTNLQDEIKSLHKALDATAGQIESLKLICPDQYLQKLHALDMELLLVRRDMHNDAQKLQSIELSLFVQTELKRKKRITEMA